MKAGLMKYICALAGLALVLTLTACHSFKKRNIHPPTPLVKDFTPTVQVKRLWEDRVGKGAGASGVRMRPVVANGVLYAASTDGVLCAIDVTHGNVLWKKRARQLVAGGNHGDTHYAGGPGVLGDTLVIGTLSGHVYAMNAENGTLLWMASLSAEVIDAPAIAGNLVMVRTQDGRVYGLDRRSGKRHWLYDQGRVPALSLRGNGPLLALGGAVFFGSDDGKLVALRQDSGEKLWEQSLASGEGRSAMERLDDADGRILADSTTLYGAAYHGKLIAVAGASGQVQWSRPFSTYTSLELDGNTLYGVDDSSQVWAFDKSTGADRWKNDKLRYRWLSAPAVQGNYVVVGDRYGYVHWLQTGDGTLAARMRLARNVPIRAQPVVVDGVVYVEDVKGHIAAYRLVAH